jgi:hypothetical protein
MTPLFGRQIAAATLLPLDWMAIMATALAIRRVVVLDWAGATDLRSPYPS